jgi:hypothetical protein
VLVRDGDRAEGDAALTAVVRPLELTSDGERRTEGADPPPARLERRGLTGTIPRGTVLAAR